MTTHQFEADVRQILKLVTHALYSDREIFLRELISNASDALDRARFESLKNDKIRTVDGEAGITIALDAEAGTITITDAGMGFTEDEASKNLGSIAHSGTKAFAEALEKSGESMDGLIGQFGVGFYSSFIVADKVVVQSLSGEPDAKAIEWICDGGESYTLADGAKETRGTSVTLHMKEECKEYVDADRVKEIVQRHSEFVQWPILLDDDRINQEQALWSRNPNEITDEQYDAFYKNIASDWQDPLFHLHIRADAPIQFNALLYVGKTRNWQLDRMDFKSGLKLFQKNIKVLDHADEVLPRYLRFVSGVVDSADVQLNVSREILQQTPVIQAIRKQLTNRFLKKLVELSKKSPEDYTAFWSEFGHILKEGVQEFSPMSGGDPNSANKKRMTELLRYRTTSSDGELRSLAEIKASMGEDQKEIWYLADVDKSRLTNSPMLEGFRKRGWEVVLMDDPVDEWVVMVINEYDDVPLKSVAHGEAPAIEDTEEDEIAKAARDQATPLVSWMKELLDETVADVRVSNRLTDSPSVLVNQEGSMGSNMERILEATNQTVSKQKRILELNPEHPMVKTLAQMNMDGKLGIEPFARLLLDHASIAEGRMEDPEGFAKRLQTLMEKAASAM